MANWFQPTMVPVQPPMAASGVTALNPFHALVQSLLSQQGPTNVSPWRDLLLPSARAMNIRDILSRIKPTGPPGNIPQLGPSLQDMLKEKAQLNNPY